PSVSRADGRARGADEPEHARSVERVFGAAHRLQIPILWLEPRPGVDAAAHGVLGRLDRRLAALELSARTAAAIGRNHRRRLARAQRLDAADRLSSSLRPRAVVRALAAAVRSRLASAVSSRAVVVCAGAAD